MKSPHSQGIATHPGAIGPTPPSTKRAFTVTGGYMPWNAVEGEIGVVDELKEVVDGRGRVERRVRR